MSHTYTENEERLQLAAEMFTRAIDLDPGFALAYAQLAEVRSSMVHYRIDLTSAADSAARNAALKAVELAPELAETHRSLGLYFYLSRREYDLALREFRLAQSLQRNDPEHLRALAIVLRRQGEWEHSCELMDEAIELDPLDWDLRFNQGVTHMFLRHYAKAANQMQRAIALKPERLQIYYWLAHVYRLWDGSGGRAESVLEKMPRSGHDMTVYAWLLQLLYEGDYERTLRLVRSIPKDTIGVRDQLIPPALVECECLLALDRVDEGRLACDEAVVALESDEDIQQEDPRLHSALAKTHALLGNKELAIGHARRAVELWPIGKDALDGCSFEVFLAEVDVTTGELESAIGILEYLLSIPSTVSVASLRHNPIWAPLRDNPRFQALLEKYDTELN
jgi:serine/threonine-protein kinase